MERLRRLEFENRRQKQRIEEQENRLKEQASQDWSNNFTKQTTKVLNKGVKQALENTIDLRSLAEEAPKENDQECLRLMGIALGNLASAMNNSQALGAAALILDADPASQAIAYAALEAEIVERRLSEERSRALILNLPGGAAFVVDRNLRYLLAEGEALAIAGFKSEDFVGHTIFEVLPPELATYYEPMYRRALAGELFEHENNAHNRTYVSRGTPLRAKNGEIYAVLAVSYDITERKRAEVALRKSEQRLSLFVTARSWLCVSRKKNSVCCSMRSTKASASWRWLQTIRAKSPIYISARLIQRLSSIRGCQTSSAKQSANFCEILNNTGSAFSSTSGRQASQVGLKIM